MNNFEKQKYSATFQKFSLLFAFYSLENHTAVKYEFLPFLSTVLKLFVFPLYGIIIENSISYISEVMIIKSDNRHFLSSWHPPGFHRHFSEPLSRNLDERETFPPCPQSSPLSGPPGEKSMSLEMLGNDFSHLFPSKVSISRRYLPA